MSKIIDDELQLFPEKPKVIKDLLVKPEVKKNQKDLIKDMASQTLKNLGINSQGLSIDKLTENVMKNFPPPGGMEQRLKIIPFKSKFDEPTNPKSKIDGEIELEVSTSSPVVLPVKIKCPKCKFEIEEGEEATVIYGDSEKKMCNQCARKSPGVGTCVFCKKRITKMGNFLADTKRRKYKLFCHEDSCRSMAEIYARQMQKFDKLVNSNSSKVCCAACGKTENLVQCSRCKKIKYCSKQCQILHWSDHKQFCFFEK